MTKMLKVCAVLVTLMMVASTASANLLGNDGFESPAIVGPDAAGAGDAWTAFDNVFTGTAAVGGLAPNAPFAGDQVLKMFAFGGAFQQFAASPGQTWNGGVFMLNSSGDQMANGQVAAVNIEWLRADQSMISFISNGTFTADDAPVDEWTQQTVTGVAPDDTAFARLVLITGDFLGGGFGGAPFFDNAFFEIVPEPGSFGLLSLGLLSLLGLRRRS